jgi:hypothetical protein
MIGEEAKHGREKKERKKVNHKRKEINYSVGA